MRFRGDFLGKWAATLILVISAGSCAINEGPDEVRVKRVSDGDACLANFAAQMERYVEGKLQDSDIDRLAQCASGAIQRFQTLVEGETHGTFTSREVRDFIQHYYLEDFEVSDSLLEAIMKVKLAMVGGKSDDFSARDLNAVSDIIHTVAAQMKLLRPHMPFSARKFKAQEVGEVEAAVTALKTVADNIASKIQNRGQVYSLMDLDKLLEQIQRAFPKATGIKTIRGKIPLAASLKSALISPKSDENQVSAEDWKILVQDGADWAGVVIRFLHLREKYSEWSHGPGRDRLAVIANHVFTLLGRIPYRHGGVMPFESLNRVIDSSGWDGSVMGTKFSLETIKKEIPPFMTKVLAGTDFGPRGRKAKGISSESIERARRAFNEWNEGMAYLEGAYGSLSGPSALNATSAFTTQEILKVPVEDALQRTGAVTKFGDSIARDLRRALQEKTDHAYDPKRAYTSGANDKNPALLSDGGSRIRFSQDLYVRPKTFADVSAYTWMRPLFRLVISGYVTGKNRSEVEARIRDLGSAGLTEDEFIQLIKDFWPALVDFKFVGKDNDPQADGMKRFMESNLFSFAANGDRFIDMNEGAHLLRYLISTHSISGELTKFVQTVCPNGEVDEFGKRTVEPECFRKNAFDFDPASSPAKDIYASFPALSQYYASLSNRKREEFKKRLEVPARKKGYQKSVYFDSTDIDAFVMMLHYIEGLYMRFDRKAPYGVLDYSESQKALKVFKRTLGQFAKMDPDSYKLKAVFAWLLTRGSPPKKGDGQIRDFLAWMGKGKLRSKKKRWKAWEIACDRSIVVNVFGTINSMVGGATSLNDDLLEEDPTLDTDPTLQGGPEAEDGLEPDTEDFAL